MKFFNFLTCLLLFLAGTSLHTMLNEQEFAQAVATGNIETINNYYTALQKFEVDALIKAIVQSKPEIAQLLLEKMQKPSDEQVNRILSYAIAAIPSTSQHSNFLNDIYTKVTKLHGKPWNLDAASISLLQKKDLNPNNKINALKNLLRLGLNPLQEDPTTQKTILDLAKEKLPESLALFGPVLLKISKTLPNNDPSKAKAEQELNAIFAYAINNKNVVILQILLNLGVNFFGKDPNTQQPILEIAKEKFPESLPLFIKALPKIEIAKRALPGSDLEKQQKEQQKRLSQTVLGLPENFTPEELKKAYRQLSKEWHSDRNRDLKNTIPDFEAYSQLFNRAYEILQDKAPAPIPLTPEPATTTTTSTPEYYTPSQTSTSSTSSTSSSFTSQAETSTNPYAKFINKNALFLQNRNITNFEFSDPTLKELDLARNPLKTTANLALDLPELNKISLWETELTAVTKDTFAKTPNLEVINLSYNQLKSGSIDRNAFANLKNLKKLDLRGNPLIETRQTFLNSHPMNPGVKVLFPVGIPIKKQKTEGSSSTSTSRSSSSTSGSTSYTQPPQRTTGAYTYQPQYQPPTGAYAYQPQEALIVRVIRPIIIEDRFAGSSSAVVSLNESPYNPYFWINRTPILQNNAIVGFNQTGDDATYSFTTNLDQAKIFRALSAGKI